MTQRRNRLGRRRKILVASAAVLAVAGAVGLARCAERLWEGDPYPVEDPSVTALRLDGHTQSVYDALALPDAELDPDWPGEGQQADSSCTYRGLKHFPGQLNDTPPSMPGVVSVSSEWALKGVPSGQAMTALRRARKQLTERGWKVTTYESVNHAIQLRLQPPDSDDTVWVATYPRGRLEVAAYAECARYPSGTPMNDGGEPDLPAPGAPAQLRG
ncbi:hypothetical protein [Streptomyces sp. NPDC001381]|uniref:hypothetical protein n=1 Tax=Streptomyces sp. NPDC001381 TaxID=3364567 RepID=UPI0036CFD654